MSGTGTATVRWLTARESLAVHLVYDDGYTVCGHKIPLADEDEGGIACGRCLVVAPTQFLRIPTRAVRT